MQSLHVTIAVSLIALFVCAQQTAQGASGCSEAGLKKSVGYITRLAREGTVDTILFKTFEVTPARSVEGANVCAVHTEYTIHTETPISTIEHDRDVRYLCTQRTSGDYECLSQEGKNVGERRWTAKAPPAANAAAAPVQAPSGCSSEAAFKYVIGEFYEGSARHRGDTRVIFKTFALGASTRYTDPYYRAVDTKAYPVKTDFTVRTDYRDAVEENDYDSRYMCYQDTHNECVCVMQMGGSIGKMRHIPK